MGGGPSGLPLVAPLREISTFGLAGMLALLPAVSRAPAPNHLRMVSIFSAAIIGDFGGMFGSSLCETRRKSRLASGSPGLSTAPEEPPAIAPVYVCSTNPPRALSWL